MIELKITIKDTDRGSHNLSTIECEIVKETDANRNEHYIRGLIFSFMQYLGESFFPKYHKADTIVKGICKEDTQNHKPDTKP